MSRDCLYIQEVLGSRYIGYRATTERKTAKELLLSGPFLYMGKMLRPQAKHIGCGVYEVWAKEV